MRRSFDRYIDFLDLEDLQARYLDQLSGGQRQRAYVAMVLAQETDYVLLDEPLNNLDIARSVEMMTMLERAAREFSRTIVIVLHASTLRRATPRRSALSRTGRSLSWARPRRSCATRSSPTSSTPPSPSCRVPTARLPAISERARALSHDSAIYARPTLPRPRHSRGVAS